MALFTLIAIVQNFQIDFLKIWRKKNNKKKILPPICDPMKRYPVEMNYLKVTGTLFFIFVRKTILSYLGSTPFLMRTGLVRPLISRSSPIILGLFRPLFSWSAPMISGLFRPLLSNFGLSAVPFAASSFILNNKNTWRNLSTQNV